MRALEHGHSGIEKFTSLMNRPKPMTQNNYDKVVDKIVDATKLVAEETMNDAANYLREMHADANRDSNVVDIGASFDGSWQRRGFSSLNGVVTAISIDSGKVLDVEAMSRSYKACCLKQENMQNDPLAYANWREIRMYANTITRDQLVVWNRLAQSEFLNALSISTSCVM